MAKRRTAAQIRATKRLVAMNKARARGNPKRSQTYWKGSGIGGYNTKAEAKSASQAHALRAGNATYWVWKAKAQDGARVGKVWKYTVKRRNPAGPRKTPLRRLKSALQLRRGRKATAEWVRAGMPAQRNRPRKNPKRRGPTLTMAQGKKLYEMGKRAPKTPIAMKTNGNKVSIVTGKAARRLAAKGR